MVEIELSRVEGLTDEQRERFLAGVHNDLAEQRQINPELDAKLKEYEQSGRPLQVRYAGAASSEEEAARKQRKLEQKLHPQIRRVNPKKRRRYFS